MEIPDKFSTFGGLMGSPDKFLNLGLRPDFFRTKTGNFENFLPDKKARFSENPIRPSHLLSGVLLYTMDFRLPNRL
jgi:hypothetical protein